MLFSYKDRDTESLLGLTIVLVMKEMARTRVPLLHCRMKGEPLIHQLEDPEVE